MHIIGVQGGATDFTPGVDNFTIFDIQWWRFAYVPQTVPLAPLSSAHSSAKSGRIGYAFELMGYLHGGAGEANAPLPADLAKPDADVDLGKNEITITLKATDDRTLEIPAIVTGMEISANEEGGNANPVHLTAVSRGRLTQSWGTS